MGQHPAARRAARKARRPSPAGGVLLGVAIAAAAIAVLGILILLISNGGWKQAGALVLMLALATRLAGIPR